MTMVKEIRITSVRNAHGVKVKRCCASCEHKCIEKDGTRVCAQMMIKVEQRFKCKQWLMSDGLKNAGKGGPQQKAVFRGDALDCGRWQGEGFGGRRLQVL